MGLFRTKKIEVPTTNDTKEVDTVELWYVKWKIPVKCISSWWEDHMEAFTTKEAADEFADSLRSASKLLGHKDSFITVQSNRGSIFNPAPAC